MTVITEDKIMETITEALELNPGELRMDSKLGDFEAWDSLGHLSILSALNDLFDGQVADIQEMGRADSIEKIFSALKSNSLL